jgi:hypothetical protein
MLNILNYKKHPTNSNYYVFKFWDNRRAADFEDALKKQSIWFEKDFDEEKEIALFAIKQKDLEQVQKINFLVEAKYRKPFISNVFLKWATILFFIIALSFALYGYFSSNL